MFVNESALNEQSLKSSPLKLLCQINRNLVGSILRRSSIKIAHLVSIRYQTWPPQSIFNLSELDHKFAQELRFPKEIYK
jgi:hypothetical protein